MMQKNTSGYDTAADPQTIMADVNDLDLLREMREEPAIDNYAEYRVEKYNETTDNWDLLAVFNTAADANELAKAKDACVYPRE